MKPRSQRVQTRWNRGFMFGAREFGDGDGDRAETLARRHAEHGEQLILDGMAQAPR